MAPIPIPRAAPSGRPVPGAASGGAGSGFCGDYLSVGAAPHLQPSSEPPGSSACVDEGSSSYAHSCSWRSGSSATYSLILALIFGLLLTAMTLQFLPGVPRPPEPGEVLRKNPSAQSSLAERCAGEDEKDCSAPGMRFEAVDGGSDRACLTAAPHLSFSRTSSLQECKAHCVKSGSSRCRSIEYSSFFRKCKVFPLPVTTSIAEESFHCLRYTAAAAPEAAAPEAEAAAAPSPATGASISSGGPNRDRIFSRVEAEDFEAVDGGRGRSCLAKRGEAAAAAAAALEEEKHFYWATSLEDCLETCRKHRGSCSGIEFGYGHCDLWSVEIESSMPSRGFTCLRSRFPTTTPATLTTTSSPTSTTQPQEEFCLDPEHFRQEGCESFCGHLDPGYDYPGGDLKYVKGVGSAEECCQECRLDGECSSWTWAKGTADFDPRTCYLKRQVVLRRVANKNLVSGVPGRDRLVQIESTSLNSCLLSPSREIPGSVIRLGLCHTHHGTLEEHRTEVPKALQWQYDMKGLQIRAGKQCLSRSRGSRTEIEMQPCAEKGASSAERAEREGQTWLIEADTGLIRSGESGGQNLCLSAPPSSLEVARTLGAASVSSSLALLECSGFSGRQLWRLWSVEALEGPGAARYVEAEERARSLFCFALVVPWTNEPALIMWQHRKGMGIFGCDQAVVYSDAAGVRLLRDGGLAGARSLDADLHAPFCGQYHTVCNTPIFRKLWGKVISEADFIMHGWIIKADADTVLLPSRLRRILSNSDLLQAQAGTGVFLKNCKLGLHGPLEVLSRQAVEAYSRGHRDHCEAPPQEDVYIHDCLLKLGVQEVERYDLLAEEECHRGDFVASPRWWACDELEKSAFHPFKTIDKWETCMSNAQRTAANDGAVADV